MSTTEALEKLKEVRELLGDESRWTRRTMARDRVGESVSPVDDTAVCWCLVGAIRKVIGHDPVAQVLADIPPVVGVIHHELGKTTYAGELPYGTGSLTLWNDANVYDDVVAAVDRTIDRMEDSIAAGAS